MKININTPWPYMVKCLYDFFVYLLPFLTSSVLTLYVRTDSSNYYLISAVIALCLQISCVICPYKIGCN